MAGKPHQNPCDVEENTEYMFAGELPHAAHGVTSYTGAA